EGMKAAPSEWKPDKMTLRPGPESVGNVLKKWKTTMAFD
ncbi:MAG TPA: peroxiredoxin, partial [Syntrophales bacterium]|nr:peroxiredoxin [Syntrophales bacterium]